MNAVRRTDAPAQHSHRFEDEGELDPRTVTLLENIAQEG